MLNIDERTRTKESSLEKTADIIMPGKSHLDGLALVREQSFDTVGKPKHVEPEQETHVLCTHLQESHHGGLSSLEIWFCFGIKPYDGL